MLSLRQFLFVSGAAVLGGLHFLVMGLFGWPRARDASRSPSASPTGMKIGAFFLYGAFVAHALFDYRFGGDFIDPLLYSGSAALVVWFAAFVFDLVDG